MSAYRLLQHKGWEDSLAALPPGARRKAVWAQVLLGAHGRTPQIKGTQGRNARWRRTPVQGNHYYLWWIPKSESELRGRNGQAADDIHTILVHSVRHHDRTDDALPVGELADYAAVALDTLDPRYEEQRAVSPPADGALHVATLRGLPGSGKTVALLYLLKDLLVRPGSGRILYVTYTPRLKRAAQEFLEGQLSGPRSALLERVRVCTLDEILRELTGLATFAEPFAELDEFYAFLERQNAADLGPWRRYPRALFSEIRAYLLGRDFPPGYDWAVENQGGGGIDLAEYARERELDPVAAETAYALAGRVRHMRFFRDQVAARVALAQTIAGKLPPWMAELDALVVDEVQDLTLLQIALLAELARARARRGGSLAFVVAGDESQIVQPSGFDWGMTKYLIGEQFDRWPDEHEFEHQRRSPDNLAQLIDNSWSFYSYLPKTQRPSARRRRQTDLEEAGAPPVLGRIVLCAPPPEQPGPADVDAVRLLMESAGRAPLPDPAAAHSKLFLWQALLAEAAARPGRALVDLTEKLRGELAGDAAEILYLPREIKGLERPTIMVHGLGELYGRAVELCADRGEGAIPRFEARRLFDEMRVALSRSTGDLILLEPAGADVLAELEVETLPGVVRMGWTDLIEALQTEEMSELEAAEGYLREVEDLVEREMWVQAYARNRRAHTLALRLEDRALQHEADVQYGGAILQEAAARFVREEWAAAQARHSAAADFAAALGDGGLLKDVEEQATWFRQEMASQAERYVVEANRLRAQRQFERAHAAAGAAQPFAALVDDPALAASIRDALGDVCWEWAAALAESDSSEALQRAGALLAESAALLSQSGDQTGSAALELLAERYRRVPARAGLQEEQWSTVLDLAQRYLAAVAGGKAEREAYIHVVTWIEDAFPALGDAFTLYYPWSVTAYALDRALGEHRYDAAILLLAQRLEAIMDRAQQLARFWDSNQDLARFRALVAGVRGDHAAASAAWEALGEPALAVEEARLAGDMARAYDLLRQMRAAPPEDLATTVKFLRLLEQLENKRYPLRPEERRRLIERLDSLKAALRGGGDDLPRTTRTAPD